MNAKILQHNDKVLYRSTYWSLNIEDMVDTQVPYNILFFKELIKEHFGAKLTHGALKEVGIPDTPKYLLYIDEYQNKVCS